MENAEKNLNENIILSVKHLSRYFKLGAKTLKAVDDVSFDVKKGEVFGIVGESGCGKTTTGRTVIGLYEASGGDVVLDGKYIASGWEAFKDDIQEIKKNAAKDKRNLNETEYEQIFALKQKIKQAKKRCKNVRRSDITKIQMIFQDPIASLDPRLTVRDIIAEGLYIRQNSEKPFNFITNLFNKKNKEHINNQVYDILEKVGLVREHANRYPHEFSGGQRQRIGIARAVIMNPEVIIADEPVSALDVSVQAQVITLLNKLRKELGLTIIFIAHDISVVKYFSDHIAVMYYGKIVEKAPKDELFKHPLHPYTKSLFSAIPVPDPVYEKNRERKVYNPIIEHDYKDDKPSVHDFGNGHTVYCNESEYKRYLKELKNE